MLISAWSSDVCSSDRIDDPAPPAVGAGRHLGRLLHEKAVAGARLLQFVVDDLLGLVVGGRHEVGRPLARDLQVIDLTEVPLEAARRLPICLEHYVIEGGAGRNEEVGMRQSGERGTT